ncbi:dethiobiotin synthase [Kangiella sp.]|uniref:dethiobiotin synthase n=1 Tax=Kangiella sp. TaxID=1920245 RepID=UPI0019B8D11A|nr:dethiobiotin synthase [Kangiella sp.]MBD3654769.1 dethiobiotin synthase [Kangiella sp.]
MSNTGKILFIAGTDTEVGKTFITQLLINSLLHHDKQVVGLKPIASGAELQSGRWVNEDGLKIHELSKKSPGFEQINYSDINPLCFEPAIAPHIAAQEAGVELSIAELNRLIKFPKSEYLLVEGAGGWLTPLNDTETYADWVEQKGMDVILVVGMKLGCLNHAMLTVRDIERRGLKLKGWVANFVFGDMNRSEQNLDWLQKNISAPCLGVVDKQVGADFTKASESLNLKVLL